MTDLHPDIERILIAEDEIQRRVIEMAAEIDHANRARTLMERGYLTPTIDHALMAIAGADEATALEMKYIHGNSVAEIADELGLGTKAAESVLSRARVAFREGFRSLWDVEPGFVVD